jgi:hypothetical protein
VLQAYRPLREARLWSADCETASRNIRPTIRHRPGDSTSRKLPLQPYRGDLPVARHGGRRLLLAADGLARLAHHARWGVPRREKWRWPDDMSSVPRSVDLTQVPAVPWAWVDEHVYAAIRGCSVKVLQNERRWNVGCTFRRINGTTVRYKFGDITAFLESQPGGGGSATPIQQPQRRIGRPRRSST